ncbi:MAG: hypothetical protein WA830_25735 [Candidatus Sulfotelmatobacter sp.]
MKLAIALLLCGLLLTEPILAQTNTPPPQPHSLLLVGFVLFCVAVGVWMIFKVSGTVPSQHTPVTLVLEKSTDGRATWAPVWTNTVTLNGTNAIEFFRDKMDDDSAFYRARVLK